MMGLRPTAWLVTVVVVSACSTGQKSPEPDAGTTGGDAGAPDVAKGYDSGEEEVLVEARQRYATVWCETLARCSPFHLEVRGWSDDTCIDAAIGAQERIHRSPRVRIGVDEYLDCATSLEQITCVEWRAGQRGDACRWSGTLQPGEACYNSAECDDGRCGRTTSDQCGVCRPYKNELDACGPDDPCNVEQVCVDGSCRRRSVVGESCDERTPCQFGLTCVDNGCMEPAELGEPCHPLGEGAPDCSYDLGTFCGLDGICEERQIVTDLQCAAEPIHCAPGSYCEGPYCAPEKREGDSCEYTDDCAWPLTCIEGSCTLRSWEACR